MTAIEALNAANREQFVGQAGFAFEHSPWIADAVWEQRPFADVAALHAAMVAVVSEAESARQLALIRAHPDLAGRVAREGRLTPSSAGEQASAGLDRLDDAMRARFDRLNAAYKERFDFPFVICAREHTSASILDALERRATNAPAVEVTTALAEIAKIARLRLEDAFA
jgi:OHCU decarboxylase